MKLFGGIIMKYLFQVSLLLVVFVGLVSCEDLDLEGEEAGQVYGLWQETLESGNNTFVKISGTEFNFYEFNASLNCVELDANQVIKQDGSGFFQVEKGDGSPERVFAVSKNGDRIHLRSIDDRPGDLRFFWPTNQDVESIPICVNETDIQGKWEFLRADENTYVDIREDSITVYSNFFSEDCFEINDFKIDGRNGNIYRLLDEVTDNLTSQIFVEIKRTPLGLEISLEEENGAISTDIYSQSSVDFSTLGPNCGNNFPSGFEGIWEYESVANTTASILRMEIKLDSLNYYVFNTVQSCNDKFTNIVKARRGDSYFFPNEFSETIDLIYQVYFDSNVLVTRIIDGPSSYDERYLRSQTTTEQLQSSLCSTD